MKEPQNPLNVAVVGSRTLRTWCGLVARLDALHGAGLLAAIVSGGACGIDALAARWAAAHGVPLRELRPDYARHGAGAPHVRNAEIVRCAELVLIVWDGRSRGTLSAARAAARLGRPCEWLAAPNPDAARPGGLALD